MTARADAIHLERVTVEAPDGAKIIDGVDLAVPAGQSVALIGRSGAGKTTLLRLMNRLVNPGQGRVLRDGILLTEENEVAVRRRTGYVLQAPALFPHRSVFDNIAVVPRLLGWAESRTREAVRSILEALQLPFDKHASRFPRSLSGGEQQRVGIARALISDPDVLLCDEPFSALDPIVRREQQATLLSVKGDRARTLVFVTHDLVEALRVAERVVMVDKGRLLFDGTRESLLRSTDPLVRKFVDSSALEPIE